jgi:hypothetical protein
MFGTTRSLLSFLAIFVCLCTPGCVTGVSPSADHNGGSGDTGGTPDTGQPDPADIPRLEVTLTVDAVAVGGQTVTLRAEAEGGVPPYDYDWRTVSTGTAGTVVLQPSNRSTITAVVLPGAQGYWTFEVRVRDSQWKTAYATASMFAL